ncbi:MAG: hypothetical protein V8S42_06730 [Lachnospiraceae bacterium]
MKKRVFEALQPIRHHGVVLIIRTGKEVSRELIGGGYAPDTRTE